MKNDKEVELAAIKIDYGSFQYILLQYAYAELKNDKEIVMAAVKQSGGALP